MAGGPLCSGRFAAAGASAAAWSTTDAGEVSRLLNDDGKPDFDLKLYLLARDGRHAGVSLWGPVQFAVTDGAGTRHKEYTFLYEKPRPE